MIPMSIHVQTLNDAKNGKGVFPDLTEEQSRSMERLKWEHIGILEGGTVGGKTSVMLLLKDEKVKLFYAETTAAIMETIGGALKGAEARFQDERTSKQ